MKGSNKKILIGLSILFVAGAAIMISRGKQKKRRVIADAGFETAHDVYFPLKINRPRISRKPG
jgi:hypothetical protein